LGVVPADTIASHKNELNRSFRATADLDHFVGVDEMIHDIVPTIETGQLGLLDNHQVLASHLIAALHRFL
jgi:hypothetical protein